MYGAKQKVKQARLHVKVPTKNPNMWPKVFRQIKKVSGVEKGKNQQHFKLNPTALPSKLNKLHSWNNSSQTDLIIVGPISSIDKCIKAAPIFTVINDMDSSNSADVSLQHDMTYGDTISRVGKESIADVKAANPVPTFWVTCETDSRIANEKGQVVLDPMKEMVDLAGGALTGFAGGISVAAPALLEILKTARDAVELVAEPVGTIAQKVKSRIEKNKNKFFTITIGILDMSEHKSSINTGRTSLNHNQLVGAICAAIAKGA